MTTIQLNKVVPNFLEKENWQRSEVWNQQISIRQGQKVQIIAPSGSGKTSLIHFLYGLRNDYNGNILYDDQPLASFTKTNLATLRKDKLSIVFQDLRLFANHTVLENIEIKNTLAPYHQPNQIKLMAEALGIGNKLTQKAGICSYGEQQRIAIIRSLQQPFTCLILDEPFSHLDDANSEKAMHLILAEAEARGAAIILADLRPGPSFKADVTYHL